MRLTYSVTTGSLIIFVLFSTSSAYCLPILISDSVEYQLPMPRPPMLRVPTAFTSSILPAFTLTFVGSMFGGGAFSPLASGVLGLLAGALPLVLSCGADAGGVEEGCWLVADGVPDAGAAAGALV